MVKSSLELDLQFCEKYGYDLIEIRTMDKLKDYLKIIVLKSWQIISRHIRLNHIWL